MLSLGFNSISKRIPWIIKIFFLIDIGLCIVYIINIMIGQPIGKINSLLDLNGESSVANWYSSTQYFCVFILSAIFSYHKIRRNRKSFPLIVLPIIFLLMSIDEIVQMHEWLGGKAIFCFQVVVALELLFKRQGFGCLSLVSLF